MLAAWAAATLAVKLTGLDLDPKVPELARTAEGQARSERPRRVADDALILKRNLFGATDLDVAGEEAPATGGADLRLRGIASSEGASFAVFENTTSGEQNVFAVGDKVFDGPRLVSVDAAGAEVLLRGRKRRYEIEEEAGAETTEGARGRGGRAYKEGSRRAGDKGKDKPGAKGKDAASGVKKTGESAYLVDRREIEHVVANLNQVITQARAVPVMNDGKSAGFKLFNIHKGSIFEKVGLEDGDIVQRVNDTELTDPSRAVGLLEEIQSMGQIRVNFVRSGKLRTHTYTIR